MDNTRLSFNGWARAFMMACRQYGRDCNNYIGYSECPHEEKHGKICVVVNYRFPHKLQGAIMLAILERIGGMQYGIWFNPDGVTIELHPINALITLD